MISQIKRFAMLLLLVLAGHANGQQVIYTQYMNNLTPLNPAYSVIDRAASVSAIFRKQWTGISGSPTTFIFNGNVPIESLKATGGISIIHDQLAVERLTEINFFLAKSIELDEGKYLAVSLNGGLRNYVANYSELDDQDPVARNDVRETKPNVGFGILTYGRRYYLGLSVPEFTIRALGTASVTSNNYFRNHYNLAGAYVFDVAEGLSVKPAVLATYSRREPILSNFSATMILQNTFGFGLNYRTSGEMAGLFTFSNDDFRLGYAYQFGTISSNIERGFRNNTHEITFTYRFGKNVGERPIL
jgi:type IX secretion system PorP/SprF family membrane protein